MTDPRPKGRPRKDRVRKVVYLDQPIADAIEAAGDGQRDTSNTVNTLLATALQRRQGKK